MPNMQEAMDKIRDEMAAKPDDGAIQAIGQQLTMWLEENHAMADKILEKGKTIAGAYQKLEDYAKNNRKGRTCVYVPPEKAMEIVAGYYGMDDVQKIQKQETHAPADLDELDLDELLGL